MNDDRVTKTAALLVIAAAGCFLLQSAAGHIAGIILPFLSAWIASAAARPTALWIARKTALSKKISGGAVTFVVFFFFGYLLIRLSGRAAEEISSLASGLGGIGDDIEGFLRGLKKKLPFSADFFDSSTYETLIAALKEAAVSLGGRLTSFLTSLCTALPGSILSFIVFVAAFYYLTSDRDRVAESVLTLLPPRMAKRLRAVVERVSGALFGYLRAYFLLMTVTFFELLIGLSILRAPYAFVISLIVAVVDALPVLGAGSILGPWAAIAFVKGNTAFGTGLLVLLGIMYLVRQFLEPRLIGRFIGVHPLVALAAVFVGYRLCGVLGMIAAPVILYTVKAAAVAKSCERGGKGIDE